MSPRQAVGSSRASLWRLEYLGQDDPRPHGIVVDPLPFQVGRRPGLALVLGLQSVSRTHAEFVNRDGALWLRDLGSKNGTFVNGRRVEEAQLNAGDIIHFADFEFRLARQEGANESAAAGGGLTALIRPPDLGRIARATIRRVREPNLGDYRISGPSSHENLSVFIVTGTEAWPGITLCTLQVALSIGKAVVHETGDVNRIVTENLMEEAAVFIQSGDIVKGGRQDRTFRFDCVVEPRSKVEMQAYCVERRRWHRRGREDETTFSASNASVPTAAMKTTIIRGLAQADVWSHIGETQDRLGETIGTRACSAESPSSYQLTTENGNVREALGGYLRALGGLGEVEHAVGAVLAINGTINRADLYVVAPLFRDLWPKILEGAAVEAVARRLELDRAAHDRAPEVEVVRSYLEDSRGGESSQHDVAPNVRITTIVNGPTTFCETRSLKPRDTWVHHGYVTEAAPYGD